MAFRHVEVDDPLSGMYLLSRAVPKVARQRGISPPVHAFSLRTRHAPMGRCLARLAVVSVRDSIHRGKHLTGRAAHGARFVANGKLPMTVAPEGGTNGHSEIVSPLEPAQLGFGA